MTTYSYYTNPVKCGNQNIAICDEICSKIYTIHVSQDLLGHISYAISPRPNIIIVRQMINNYNIDIHN